MSEDKIKFYVNPDRRLDGVICIPLLFPFWGIPHQIEGSHNFDLFNKYSFDTNYYELVDDIEKADFVLIPYRYNTVFKKHKSLIDEYVKEANEHNKPILIDGTGDIEEPISIKNAYILRIGGYRFSKKDNEIVIPTYGDDFLESYFGGNLQLREKSDKPIVGFSGWASLSLKQRIRTTIKELPVRFVSIFNEKYKACKKGVFFREEIISYLIKSDLINTNFLIRRSYSGNTITAEKDVNELKREFVDNLLNSDYGLSVRGDANASVRFYETMSMGRIPLLIDTECNLPFNDTIDYKDFCVIVDFRNMKNADKILFDFHKNLTDDKFKEMQRKAREAYLEYFRIDGMTKHLVNKLRKISIDYK